jgi:hypothetical protein
VNLFCAGLFVWAHMDEATMRPNRRTRPARGTRTARSRSRSGPPGAFKRPWLPIVNLFCARLFVWVHMDEATMRPNRRTRPVLSARPVGSRGNSRRMSFRSAQSIVSLPMCVDHTIARNSVSVVVAVSVYCCRRGPFAVKATMRAIGRGLRLEDCADSLGYD